VSVRTSDSDSRLPTVTDHLRVLDLGGPGALPLVDRLQSVRAAAQRSVPSCLCVSVRVAGPVGSFTVLALSPAATGRTVRSSVSVRLRDRPSPVLRCAGPAGASRSSAAPAPAEAPAARPVATFVVQAAAVDALGRFARELVTMHGWPASAIRLDGHLAPCDQAASALELTRSLEDASAVDRAVGLLLDRRGWSAPRGLQELRRAAAETAIGLPDVARAVLARGPDDVLGVDDVRGLDDVLGVDEGREGTVLA
jgi:hypothetical protein